MKNKVTPARRSLGEGGKQSKHIIILVTAKDKAQATKIAKSLLADRLIACVNIVDGVTSLFRWEGKIDQSAEVLMILKTTGSLFKKVEAKVKSLHSYQLPEIIALPITNGSVDYLKWIGDCLYPRAGYFQRS